MIRLALKAVMANTKRSRHVIITVALSVMIVFSSFSIAEGLFNSFEGLTMGYSATDICTLLEEGKPISESMLEAGIEEDLLNIEAASPIIMAKANIPFKDSAFPVEVWGVDLPSFHTVRRLQIKGEAFSSWDEALIGSSLATKLGIGSGYELRLVSAYGEARVLLTGVFESSSPYDEGLIVSFACARLLRPEMASSYSLIELKFIDVAAPGSTMEELDKLLEGVDVYPGMAGGRFLLLISAEAKKDLVVLSSVIFSLALIAVYHSMLTIVKESRWELMVLRFLGVTRRGLAEIILLDALILCLAGGVIGLALGELASNAASIAVIVLFKTSYLRPVFSFSTAFSCLALSMLVGLIGGVVPAYRSSKMGGAT